MRTTLTLDDDLAMALHNKAHDEGRTFKDVVNEVIRRGLVTKAPPKPPEYRVKAFDMGLRAGIDIANINDLLGEMDAQRYLEIARRYEPSNDGDRQDVEP